MLDWFLQVLLWEDSYSSGIALWRFFSGKISDFKLFCYRIQKGNPYYLDLFLLIWDYLLYFITGFIACDIALAELDYLVSFVWNDGSFTSRWIEFASFISEFNFVSNFYRRNYARICLSFLLWLLPGYFNFL